MVDGIYLRRVPIGKYKAETMNLDFCLKRGSINFQFAREGNFILNLQGTILLGVFVPNDSKISDVVASLEDDYGYTIQIGE